MRIKLLLFSLLFSYFSYAQQSIDLKEYVLINDIGIKVIDKKKLSKDIDKMDLTKTELKALKKNIKEQKKNIKKELKSYNKEVYKKRKEQEYAIRMGMQSSTDADTSFTESIGSDILHAKKLDKVFDKKASEVDTLITEELPSQKEAWNPNNIVPPKRHNYPWAKDIMSGCNWKIHHIDPVERDTILASKNHTIYWNEKEKNDQKGTIKLRLIREANQYFFEIDLHLILSGKNQPLIVKNDANLMIVNKKKKTFQFPFYGIPQTAAVDYSGENQKLIARFLIDSKTSKKTLFDKKWSKILLSFGGNKFEFHLSKNLTQKAEDSDIKSLFEPYFSCIQL
ncbi:MAG: hypothetical protein N4A45_01740 [Flavobacteriales bacterium]|jgi:hypothetical protein|nr:hypothetical protein [Flavobacteriales bacterium]